MRCLITAWLQVRVLPGPPRIPALAEISWLRTNSAGLAGSRRVRAAPEIDYTVLEVGTGSGYQAAILARLMRKVCTVEIIPPLAEAAAKVLRDLGYDNLHENHLRRGVRDRANHVGH
jgi:methylase of polypeptide subunit release factors